MSLLEDRLLRIIELRQAGKSPAAVARSLHLSEQMVLHYESSLKVSMEEILREGVSTLGEVAAKLKMTRTVTGMAMDYFRLKILEKEAPPVTTQGLAEKMQPVPNTHAANISRLADEGKTRREIAQELGISYEYLSEITRQEGIVTIHGSTGRKAKIPFSRPLKPKSSRQIALDIKTDLEQGERSLEKLVQHAQCGIIKFHSVRKEYGITLPEDIIPYRYRPELDRLVDEGLNLDEIAARYTQETGKRLSKQAVEQYLMGTGQKFYWEKKKEERKTLELIPEQEEQQEDLRKLQALKIYLTTLAKAEDWAHEKAVESLYARKQSTTLPQFTKMLRLFQIYDDAKKEGKKMSLDELAEKSQYSPTRVSNMLRAVNVPTMCEETYIRSRRVTEEKRERIGALTKAGLPLTAPDVEYFTGIGTASIGVYLSQLKILSSAVSTGIKRFWNDGDATLEQLDYRTASKLFEADDAGLSAEEKKEYAGVTNEKIITYAFRHRQEIEPVITKALQILFPEENITTPYRNSTESLDEVLLREYDPVHLAYQHLPWKPAEVGYFVGLNDKAVRNFYQQWGGKEKKSQMKRIVPSEKGRKGHLTLRTASQIYELEDGRVAEKKITKKLHLQPEVVEYTLHHRREYEKEIINGLRIMFPKEEIEKPYR